MKSPIPFQKFLWGCASVALLTVAQGQVVFVNGSGNASFENQVYALNDGLNYHVFSSSNGPNATAFADFFESGFVGRAHGVTHGSYEVGTNSFAISGDASGLWQGFGSNEHPVGGAAAATENTYLTLTFSNPTLFTINAGASGAWSGRGSGGAGQISMTWDTGTGYVSGGDSETGLPIVGSLHRSGLTGMLQLNLQTYGSAGAHNLTNSSGAGIGSAFATGTLDFDVINPGAFNNVIFKSFLGSVGGACTTFATYPPPVTYTGKTGILDNIQSLVFDPPAGTLIPFGYANWVYATVIYKIGVTQSFYFSLSYQMNASGPLVRFASPGQATARIDYPPSWTNTCLLLTNIVLTPPPGSFLPIGTNHCNAAWSLSTGLNGNCPFDIIVKTNLTGAAALQKLRAEFPDDSDGDGMADWQELLAGTEMLDATSVLKLEAPVLTATNLTLAWPTVPGIRYRVEAVGVVDGGFVPIGDVITGTEGLVTTNVVVPLQSSTNRFYRIRVVTD